MSGLAKNRLMAFGILWGQFAVLRLLTAYRHIFAARVAQAPMAPRYVLAGRAFIVIWTIYALVMVYRLPQSVKQALENQGRDVEDFQLIMAIGMCGAFVGLPFGLAAFFGAPLRDADIGLAAGFAFYALTAWRFRHRLLGERTTT